MGWLIRGHAPRGDTAPPPPCTPRDTARWRHRGAAGALATGPLSPDAALGGHRSVRRAGMGRAAAGSRGRCRQRRRLPSRRQQRRRRRAPGRRKAPAYRRRRMRPRRKEPRSWKSSSCDLCQDPVRAGPPTQGGGVPCPLGHLVRSPALPAPWSLQLNVPCARRLPAPLRRRSSCLFLGPGSSLSRDPPGISCGGDLVGTWLDELAGVFGFSGLEVSQPLSCSPVCVLQCASRDDWRCAQSMHDFSAKDIDGRTVNLDKYRWVPTCLVGEAEGRSPTLTTPSHLQGLRVHRHQRGLAMRQNRRKLHSACRPARPIC